MKKNAMNIFNRQKDNPLTRWKVQEYENVIPQRKLSKSNASIHQQR